MEYLYQNWDYLLFILSITFITYKISGRSIQRDNEEENGNEIFKLLKKTKKD